MVRIIIILLFSVSALASECHPPTIYTKTSGEKVSLCFDKTLEDFVSKSCLIKCKARSFLSEESSLTIKELKGGKDPHSVACAKKMGKLNLYRDEKQNEYAFCEAEDGSSVSADLIKYKIK